MLASANIKLYVASLLVRHPLKECNEKWSVAFVYDQTCGKKGAKKWQKSRAGSLTGQKIAWKIVGSKMHCSLINHPQKMWHAYALWRYTRSACYNYVY